MNAIGYAHFELNGGTRRLLRWVIAIVALAVVGLAAWSRNRGGFAAAAGDARFPLALTLGILLIVVVNARIGAAIRRDAVLDMSRSHRLMPQPAASAVAGYIVGSSLSVLAGAGTIILIGVACTLAAGGNPATWLFISAVLVMFGAMTWCFTAVASMPGRAARGDKTKGSGGMGWVPWVFIGPAFGTGGSILAVVPAVVVLLGPLIGRTIFTAGSVSDFTWAHGASAAFQAGFAAIFFIAACRKYERDEPPAMDAVLWLGIIALIVGASLVGIARFEAFRPQIFRNAELWHNVAVPATLCLLLLLLPAGLAASERRVLTWRYRRNVGDPLADESRPGISSLVALVAFLAIGATFVIFAPDTEIVSAGSHGRAWALTGASFFLGAVLLFALVRIGHRLGPTRVLSSAVLLLWVLPILAAAAWAFREDGNLTRTFNPIASFSTPGAILAAWLGRTDGGQHAMTASTLAYWPGVAFQALVAAGAVLVAARVPDRMSQPAVREEPAPVSQASPEGPVAASRLP